MVGFSPSVGSASNGSDQIEQPFPPGELLAGPRGQEPSSGSSSRTAGCAVSIRPARSVAVHLR
jgi:hypothetical protein